MHHFAILLLFLIFDFILLYENLSQQPHGCQGIVQELFLDGTDLDKLET